jgi:dihydropyrimidine dehydrogenase (NAD+) subunit PreA
MKETVDLSVKMAGVAFPSPILVASSECASNPSMVKNLLCRGIGGIVTKTFTTKPELRVRVRPYQFPLGKFGKAYSEGGCLYSLAAPHVEDPEVVNGHVARMAELCKSSGVVLIVSFFEDPDDADLWIRRAGKFEELGAYMLELNFSSPSAARTFSKSLQSAGDIISQVKRRVSVPIGLKLSPTLEPLEKFVQICVEEGLDFITAHNASSGIFIDVEREVPFGAPSLGGYVMGRAFLPYSLGRIVRIRKTADIPVIGVGGIYEASDALQYLLWGCPLVGVGAALYFEGPGILQRLCRDISAWMQARGYKTVDEFLGKAFALIQDPTTLKTAETHPHAVPPECPYVPVIDKDACTLCGACEKTCIYQVFKLESGKEVIYVDEEKCWSCGFCVGICPAGAIELRDRKNRKKLICNNQGIAETFPI